MKRIYYYSPVILWGILLISLSTFGSITLPPSLWDFIAVDKWGHAGFYFILTALLFWGFRQNGLFNYKKISFWGLTIPITLGIIIEICQFLFFPSRYFEIFDIFANIIGILAAYYLLHKIKYF